MGEQGGLEMLFRRVVHPAFDPIDHVNKLGIKLKSTALSENNRKRPSSPRSLRSFRIRSAKTRLSQRAKSSITRFTPTTQNVQLIHNMVVPINAPDDEYNVKTSNAPHSFSPERARAVGLPHMIRNAAPRSPRPSPRTPMPAPGNKSPRLLSARSTRTNTTAITLCSQSSAGVSQSVLRESQNTTPHWKHREQPLRFEHEQQSLYRSQSLKRSSELQKRIPGGFIDVENLSKCLTVVRPHRVDRMYYMSGTSLDLKQKYFIDDDEMQRMKEMAEQRRNTKHYGRGLSRYKYFGLPTQTNLPDTFLRLPPTTPVVYPGVESPSNPSSPTPTVCSPRTREKCVKYLEEGCHLNVYERLIIPYNTTGKCPDLIITGIFSNRNNSNNDSSTDLSMDGDGKQSRVSDADMSRFECALQVPKWPRVRVPPMLITSYSCNPTLNVNNMRFPYRTPQPPREVLPPGIKGVQQTAGIDGKMYRHTGIFSQSRGTTPTQAPTPSPAASRSSTPQVSPRTNTSGSQDDVIKVICETNRTETPSLPPIFPERSARTSLGHFSRLPPQISSTSLYELANNKQLSRPTNHPCRVLHFPMPPLSTHWGSMEPLFPRSVLKARKPPPRGGQERFKSKKEKKKEVPHKLPELRLSTSKANIYNRLIAS